MADSPGLLGHQQNQVFISLCSVSPMASLPFISGVLVCDREQEKGAACRARWRDVQERNPVLPWTLPPAAACSQSPGDWRFVRGSAFELYSPMDPFDLPALCRVARALPALAGGPTADAWPRRPLLPLHPPKICSQSPMEQGHGGSVAGGLPAGPSFSSHHSPGCGLQPALPAATLTWALSLFFLWEQKESIFLGGGPLLCAGPQD